VLTAQIFHRYPSFRFLQDIHDLALRKLRLLHGNLSDLYFAMTCLLFPGTILREGYRVICRPRSRQNGDLAVRVPSSAYSSKGLNVYFQSSQLSASFLRIAGSNPVGTAYLDNSMNFHQVVFCFDPELEEILLPFNQYMYYIPVDHKLINWSLFDSFAYLASCPIETRHYFYTVKSLHNRQSQEST
jgi:hypothetical protein